MNVYRVRYIDHYNGPFDVVREDVNSLCSKIIVDDLSVGGVYNHSNTLAYVNVDINFARYNGYYKEIIKAANNYHKKFTRDVIVNNILE